MKKIQIILCVILLLLCTSCIKSNEQYQFPLEGDDVQKVLDNLNLDWEIENVSHSALSNQIIVSLKSDDGIGYGVATSTHDNNKVASITWMLPFESTREQVDEYYKKDIMDIFNLTIELYDNNKQMKKAFDDFLKYYDELDEEYENDMYWVKRIGDEHLRIQSRTINNQSKVRNKYGSILILKNEQYEDDLKRRHKIFIENLEERSLQAKEVSVEELNKHEKIAVEEIFEKCYFVVQGHLENIKEQKGLPESIKKIVPLSFISRFSENYLKAKLVDETGSVDVLLPMISLNKKELMQERNHDIFLFYDGDNPVIFVHISSLIE